MVTRKSFWRLLATVPFLGLFIPSPAACQEAQGTSARGEATQFDYSNSRSFPNVLSPYTIPFVPDPRLDNSRRLQNLIVGGKLMLALDDAIALALENNLDIAVARYNLPIAQTDLLRAKAGGAARGVAGSYQSTTLFSGVPGRRCGRRRRRRRPWRGRHPGRRHQRRGFSGLLRSERLRLLWLEQCHHAPELHGGERCAD